MIILMANWYFYVPFQLPPIVGPVTILQSISMIRVRVMETKLWGVKKMWFHVTRHWRLLNVVNYDMDLWFLFIGFYLFKYNASVAHVDRKLGPKLGPTSYKWNGLYVNKYRMLFCYMKYGRTCWNTTHAHTYLISCPAATIFST